MSVWDFSVTILLVSKTREDNLPGITHNLSGITHFPSILKLRILCHAGRDRPKYDIVKSQMGKDLILVGGYTFSQHSIGSRKWVCSTKNRDCKAKLTLDVDGHITGIFNEHCHPPRRYIKTSDGTYIRYDIVKSQMGKDLILIGGYTFCQASSGTRKWVCSTKNRGCKAKLTLDMNGHINKIFNEHCHPPKMYMKTSDGKYIRHSIGSRKWVCSTKNRDCKAKLTLDVDGLNYEIVKSQRGKDLIMFQGYTFATKRDNYWVCSTNHPVCKAKIRLGRNKAIIWAHNVHIHPPKKWLRTSNGTYVKV
ncbi:hypothetical protein ABMA28_001403 [Loxostege sticticalis]|uniref:FLYWCH-type domain-containing protein n=1 Tax=Loxostege sticticalis TaxID=481309 RepID=A0ABD0T1I5_LOXSC